MVINGNYIEVLCTASQRRTKASASMRKFLFTRLNVNLSEQGTATLACKQPISNRSNFDLLLRGFVFFPLLNPYRRRKPQADCLKEPRGTSLDLDIFIVLE